MQPVAWSSNTEKETSVINYFIERSLLSSYVWAHCRISVLQESCLTPWLGDAYCHAPLRDGEYLAWQRD